MSARVRTNTSRSRFDEAKRFTGVYQRMGQVGVDADWNEEVSLRTLDARRRTADVAGGSPDDGFRIQDDFVIDPIGALAGWAGVTPPPDDQRKIVPELRLDRHDPETLPWVIRSRWYAGVTRTLPAPLDLTAVRGGGTTFAASAIVFELRIDRVVPDDEDATIELFLADGTTTAAVAAADHGFTPGGWRTLVVPIGAFAGIALGDVRAWGVRGLPPVAITRIGALRVVDPGLGTDVVIRGGDGTLPGAGRMLVEGVRVFNEGDLRYSAQPDFPGAPAIPALAAGRAHVFYLDVWETTVTALDDASLLEPALDGVDTAARLRVVSQVRLLADVDPAAAIALPTATGTGRLSTNIAAGALPDRDPPEPIDPCRDRCLFSVNASIGEGYIGSENLHVRIEVLQIGSEAAIVWSRDNGSTVMRLAQAAPSTATSIKVAAEDAARLRSGDLIVIEDRATRLRWDLAADAAPVVRRLRGVQAETGILELDDPGTTITFGARTIDVGGALGRAFDPAAGAQVRRWDGADLLITGVRYRLSDGITFAFAGSGFRAGDYWTFTARIHAPDGAARGVVDQLDAVLPHGPVHHYVPLARATGAPRVLEDLRPRYLPLGQVRDRLKELADRRVGPAVFTIVIGDGKRSFGDFDQALDDGITGDEALQSALALLGDAGGSIFVRAGDYQLEHTVLVRAAGPIRILGDGDATRLEVRGAGGAFYVDRVNGAGAVTFEDLHLIEDPSAEIDIGEPDPARAFELELGRRLAPLPQLAERALAIEDLAAATPQGTFLELVADRIKTLEPGEGRAAGSVVATLVALRRLQRQHPGQPLEDVPDAQPLLTALHGLPHGVITVADARDVAIRRCTLDARRAAPNATGILLTGRCHGIAIVGCRIHAAIGVAAVSYAPFLAPRALIAFPRAHLALHDVAITGNELLAAGAASTGIHLADGVLTGVAIRDNAVEGYGVGVLVQDADESVRDVAIDRLVVDANRITADVCGIQAEGDGVDVTGNEITLRTTQGALVQAGIAVAGHGVRVAGSWIVLPAGAASSPLGLCAGIVIGDGVDEGHAGARAVSDVEVVDNRVDGPGEGLTNGIVVGGPQAIYDVRIKDNVLRNLGEAAVRSFSTSGPIGRLRIEGNRVERAASADVRAQADNAAALALLAPEVARTLANTDTSRPRPLLQALVAHAASDVRPALDAVLRWVERLCLRGAIALGGVDGVEVIGNRLAEIGRSEPYTEATIDGARIRMAAIATVACVEVVIAGNSIEAVRAPFRRLEGGEDGVGRPEMLDVLDQLATSADERIDLADVHLATVDLRERLLRIVTTSPDEQVRVLRGLFGPLDATVAELVQLGGRHAALAEPLAREIAQLRTAGPNDQGTAILHATRATLTQAASLTAADAAAQDAWDAAAQLDLAVTKGPEAIAATVKRLLARIEDLTAGLAPELQKQAATILRRTIEAPQDPRLVVTAATLLGQIAALRDQQVRRKDLPATTDLVGPRKTIVAAFAERAMQQIDGLGTAGSTSRDRIDALRTSKDALVAQLREVHGPLALDVEADFRDVDRTAGASPDAIKRFASTLQKTRRLAEGAGVPDTLDAAGAARAASTARAASIHLYSKTLDRHITGLLGESPESVEKSLGSFPLMMRQLAELSADDADVAGLAEEASKAVETALADPARRSIHLSSARTLLDRIRGNLVPVLPPLVAPPTRAVEPVERRLAGVAALTLDLDAIAPAFRTATCDALAAHLERALAVLRADASVRQRAVAAVEQVRATLDGSADARAAAQHALASQIDAIAELARVANDDAPGIAALVVLATAARFALDPAEDAASRLGRIRTLVAARTAQVSPVLAAQLAQVPDLGNATVLLREALERLARGEAAGRGDDRPPVFAIEPEAADGVFVAGPQVRVRVAGNTVEDALAGIVVTNAAGHVSTEPADDGAVIEIGENQLAACAAVGAEVRTDGVSAVVVWNNHVYGCAGIAIPGTDAWGHAVVEIVGRGELIVRGNVLRENGNRATRTLLHEVVIDWRGDVAVKGNTLRHLGGGAGGSALMIVADPPTTPTRIPNLTRSPFLGVEPAPRPTGIGRPAPNHTICALDMTPLATQLAVGSPQLELGGLRQQLGDVAVVHRALTLTAPMRTAPPVATTLADRYLDTARVFVKSPLLDFLKRPPIRIPLPRPRREVHAAHVEGNDISAHGPALLLYSEGTLVWATTVVGNELRSSGKAGAVYVRNADATVFTGNRCQNLDVVTAVVLRIGKAPLSATGNVILGAQPITRPRFHVLPEIASGVSLQVGLGKGALSIPLDPRTVLGGLERRRLLASETFSEVLADVVSAAPTTTRMLSRVTLPEGTVDEITREALTAALPTGIETPVGARTVYDRAGEGDTPVAALRKVVDRVAMHTSDPNEAKVKVGALLTASSGDPRKALKLLDEQVIGLDTAKPTVKESVTNSSLLAEALADHLSTIDPFRPVEPLRPFPRPRPLPLPPSPSARSFVVIGGTHVAVVGNSTTAGTLVLEADQVVELNV